MAEKSATRSRSTASIARRPASARIAADGINTGRQCAMFLSALIGDVMNNRVTQGAANAATNAVGKLLKVVELQYRHGARASDGEQDIRLAAN